jgi:hydrogenase nickel incorporation protein HypA/HybF
MRPCWTRCLLRPYVGARMHEVGIMEAALEAVLNRARVHGAQRVHRIVLRIGALSGVDADSLRFAFDAVTPGTIAAEALLEIRTVAAIARCSACDADFTAEAGAIFSCPRCCRLSGDVRQGRELELSRIEMS